MKYLKLNSVTWWASFVPLLLGIFVGTEPLHGHSDWVRVVNSLTGDLSPAVMINAGLFGIGVRGAIQ